MVSETILIRILDMHDEMVAQKNVQIQELAQELRDLDNKIQEAKPVLTYTLAEIGATVILARNNPGKKIHVIKYVRDKFGRNLKETKDLVDAIMLPDSDVEKGWS